MKSIFVSTLLSPIKARYLYAKKMSLWRKRNPHNHTIINEYCPIDVVTVGKETYGKLNVHWYGKEEEKLAIGNFCSIADQVHFVLGGEHDYKRLVTYPFPERIYHEEYDGICKGPIIVEDDVWIGFGAIILSGVVLGQGCVIGAGSVVTKDVPPYAIWVGNGIKKYRFDTDTIQRLTNVNISNIDYEMFKRYSKETITRDNIDNVLECLER